MAEFLLSIVGSAVIAGVIEALCLMFGKDPNYFLLWVVVFAAWWGIYYVDFDIDIF